MIFRVRRLGSDGFAMKLYFFLLLFAVNGFASAQSGNDSPGQQAQMHDRKAQELLAQKNPELAAKEFAAVLALDPNNLDAQANLGVLLFFQKNYAAAEPLLRSALNQRPDLTKIRALLGMCERHTGKTDLARADLEAAMPDLKEPNARLNAGLELIELYTETQEWDKAAGLVATLRQDAPADPRVLYAANRIYTELAEQEVRKLAVTAPGSGQMYMVIAHELILERNLNGAIANFRKALAADPHLPGIHFELAEALNSSLEPALKSEAEPEYKLAIAANKFDEKALTRLGDITADKGNFDEATTYYKQALALSPGDTDAEIGLAFIFVQKNDLNAALPLLEHVVADDPTNVLAHYRLSTVYHRLNRPDDAKREVAEYKKYKDMKEKLRMVYKDMRFETQPLQPDK
jgi:Tfp pilus assembly protein PilF